MQRHGKRGLRVADSHCSISNDNDHWIYDLNPIIYYNKTDGSRVTRVSVAT